MANNKVMGLANITYPLLRDGTKEEMAAIASCILVNPELDTEYLADQEKVDELIRGKFATQENEAKYKQVLSVVSAIVRGTMKQVNCSLIIPKKEVKEMKDNGLLDSFKKTGIAGDYRLFIEDYGNQN